MPVTRLAFLSNIQHRHHFCRTCSERVWLGLNKHRAQLLSGTSVYLSDEISEHLGIIQHTKAYTSHSTAGFCALGTHPKCVASNRKVLKLFKPSRSQWKGSKLATNVFVYESVTQVGHL